MNNDSKLETNDILPTHTGPVVLSREDRLRAENLHLKGLNLQMQIQKMQQGLQEAGKAGQELQTEIEALRQEYIRKYGIDLATANIQPDGTVVDQPGSGVPAQVQAMIGTKG
jgi:hypothetical protein